MYKRINTSSEPPISGICKVRVLEKRTFISDDEKKYYNEYFNDDVKSFLTTNFKNIEKNKLTKLTYFPFKKPEETDFISFSPHKSGLDFMVSQKVMDIFEQFSIADYIKIPSKIEGFKSNYYTVGFPMIPEDKIDLSNSEFICALSREIITGINAWDEYLKRRNKLSGEKIKMINKLPFDIIKVQGQCILFSDKLIEKLEQENITGLQIHNRVLE